jgi:AhpD family alkylhydroperoxidase
VIESATGKKRYRSRGRPARLAWVLTATGSLTESFAADSEQAANERKKTMYSKDNLKKVSQLGDLAPEATRTFWAYDKAALADGAIPKKYKELMAIAVALTTQCPYCIDLHRQAALAAGVTEEQLAEAVHVTAALRAGAAITHGTHLFEK